jgi:hypothetical protein
MHTKVWPRTGFSNRGDQNARKKGNPDHKCRCFIADDRTDGRLLGVDVGRAYLAGVPPLAEVKVEGTEVLGTTIRHDADPC